MNRTSTSLPFYETLPRVRHFGDLSDLSSYIDLPVDWIVGVADVQGSTNAVADGKYKSINMVGAAVISAQINGLKGHPFPFVFGGDGAAFATEPKFKAEAAAALSAVKRWSKTEFDIELRVALVPVSDILAAGLAIRVARFQASDHVDYAMFGGGGLSWAENQMKAGAYSLPMAPEGTSPDLTGLSCRWSPVRSRNGTIVSLVLQKAERSNPAAYASVVQEVIAITSQLDRSGHPVLDKGPALSLKSAGLDFEVQASDLSKNRKTLRRKILKELFFSKISLLTGLKFGGFDARKYAKVLSQNSDFRKFDDGLKMTLDCDPKTLEQLEQTLCRARQNGIVKFGIFQQDQAMVTCIVPSYLQDDHIHFVDGASGGYTQAAAQIKSDL